MAWLLLFVSGLLEIVWSSAMKQSEGFTRPVPSAVTVVAALVGFWLLALAMRDLPLGTAYAVWVGIGAVGAFIVGVTVLGEPLTPLRAASAGLIVLGIVGLRVSA